MFKSKITEEQNFMYEAKLRFTKTVYIFNADDKKEAIQMLKAMGKNPMWYTITKVLID